VDSGHAYATDGHVLFDVESFPEYGALSGRELDDMISGARVEVAEFKRHPGDFVLWKPSEDPLPGWDSPWGYGRPGWHIECSVMAEKHLGETIDIHAGGQDLVFPHHENEIAQSVCAHHGKPFAHYWLHNGFVTVSRRKMSKSLGNTLVVHDLLEQERGETLRYQLLGAHYRQPLDWSDEALAQSRRTLDRMYAVLRDVKQRLGALPGPSSPGDDLLEALRDDLNTPVALAEMNRTARGLGGAESEEQVRQLAAQLLAEGGLMGLLGEDPDAWFEGTGQADSDAEIDQLIQQREAARAERDFARADAIRDQLQAMGIILEDGAGGTRWRRQLAFVMHDPKAAQDAIIADFSLFPDWMDRYQYLIDLGRKLPELDATEKVDQNLLSGCQSRVWLLLSGDAEEIEIRANSDAAIVSGLIALLVRVYSGASARQVLETEPYFIEAIDLTAHLSSTRSNGLHAMLQAISSFATAALQADQ
jgi:cysteinyl-tRNA synthetase